MTEIKCDYCGEMYTPITEDSEMCYECLWDQIAGAFNRAARNGDLLDGERV